MSTTTKAYTFTRRGPPSAVLTPTTTHPLPPFPPTPLAEEWLLLKISHTALNPGSLFYMRLLPLFARRLTAVPEMDFAAEVLDVWAPDASRTARFARGDRVIGFIPAGFMYSTGVGALQGHVALPARMVVRSPEGVEELEGGGAGLMLAGACALALLKEAGVREGDRVLVYGASGGIGSFVVQMARMMVGEKGWVVGVCSGGNVELVRSLGADEVIDYTRYKSMPAELRRRYGDRPFDAVADCVGVQEVYVNCAPFVKPHGVYAAMGTQIDAWTYGNMVYTVYRLISNAIWPLTPWLGGTGRRWRVPTVFEVNPETMEKLAGMLADGKIRVVVDSVWPFEEALRGYEILESKRARGKVIIRVGDDVD